MQIVHYPHPTLRHKSKPIKRVDAELKAIVRQMFDLMYEARGVGLAANQVDLPLRLFIMNETAKPDEGEEFVFINPVLSKPKGNEEGEEGCLSLPEVYGQVKRPKNIHVQAFSLEGKPIDVELTGLTARIVQHETDHLDGIMFIDRMSEAGRKAIEHEIEEFEIDFTSRRNTNEIPPDEDIVARLAQIEAKYC